VENAGVEISVRSSRKKQWVENAGVKKSALKCRGWKMQQPCNFDRAAFSTPAFSAPPHAVHCKTSKINSFSSFFDVAVVGLLEFVNYSEIARPYPTSTKHSSSQSKYFFSLLKTNKLCGRRVRPTRYAPPQDFW